MIRLTDEQCARCDNALATSNRHKDRLCGQCQRELGASRGTKSLAFREWIDRGRKREIARATVPMKIPTVAEPSAEDERGGIATRALVDRIRQDMAELRRRQEETEAAAAEVSKLLGSPIGEEKAGE